MTDLVRSWSSEISHITDNPEAGEVLTRCGRTLKRFNLGYPGENCPKCGSQDDYDGILEAKRQAYAEGEAKRKIAKAEREARADELIEAHRATMQEFLSMLIDNGAEDIETDQRAAGGKIEFRKNGLKFELSGTIHK